MEDTITFKQITKIADMIVWNEDLFGKYLSEKIIDGDKIGTFIDWCYNLKKEEAEDLITIMEDKNSELFKYFLEKCEYSTWIEMIKP